MCRLTFERMIAAPDRLYGPAIGSSYQGQVETLSKHFRREYAEAEGPEPRRPAPVGQPQLFPAASDPFERPAPGGGHRP